uniref:photosystem I reaction center subunit III (plastocyanin-binding) n=1 Tax=Cryptomonas gyropyrenoidosa TaxID=233257 RepID=UPI00279E3AA9|nr:photosystem I reaction center subunit III (plastocyanin-binding) [Cryptomonas gyropyrenoidosa]WFQ82945.1 photosystem I reaction center subunit III (plastocyanin-binding) [Cryptomonas gyropyrenoidosa]
MKNWISLLLIASLLITSSNANADVSGLKPCKESKEFQRRLDQSVKKLESRLKKYEPGTPPSLALQKQIEKTQNRFNRYGNAGLLCGTDGLPHLIADGRWNHSGEFMIPGMFFIYIAGWIGWVGRSYVQWARSSEKPTEKEIIIDVPVALSFATTGFIWPFSAFKEFTSGNLIASAEEITVSPR